jgi:hypothetical protein
MITLRAGPRHQPGLLEPLHVMRQQIARQPEDATQLARRGVAQQQSIHDRQAGGITQGRMASRPHRQFPI